MDNMSHKKHAMDNVRVGMLDSKDIINPIHGLPDAILTNFIVFDKYNKKTMNFSNKEYIAIVIGLLLVVLLSQTPR